VTTPLRGRLVASISLAMCLGACATARDSVGGGDSRLDEDRQKEDAAQVQRRSCGPDGPGDVVLLDSRTGGPVTCLSVTVTREPMSCAAATECPSETLFKGFTSAKGQLKLIAPVEKSRLVAVADGFAPSMLSNATSVKDRVLELELMPAEGFWLKVLDGEGNYLADTTVTFKQGEDVVAQLRANTLANVFFTQRQPFSGQPVDVEATGYKTLTITSAADLGDDGHTLTLQK
jgi:hypothetical protein